jgi:hypothetical protein
MMMASSLSSFFRSCLRLRLRAWAAFFAAADVHLLSSFDSPGLSARSTGSVTKLAAAAVYTAEEYFTSFAQDLSS